MARVVKSVLTAWSAMKIYPNFHTGCFSPSKGSLKKCVCSLNIWSTRIIISPEADWDSESIYTSRSDGVDVIFGKVGAPVAHHSFFCTRYWKVHWSTEFEKDPVKASPSIHFSSTSH